MTAQLDLFLSNDDESLNAREIVKLNDYITRSNRAIFAQIRVLGNEIVKLRQELDKVRGLLVKEKK